MAKGTATELNSTLASHAPTLANLYCPITFCCSIYVFDIIIILRKRDILEARITSWAFRSASCSCEASAKETKLTMRPELLPTVWMPPSYPSSDIRRLTREADRQTPGKVIGKRCQQPVLANANGMRFALHTQLVTVR